MKEYVTRSKWSFLEVEMKGRRKENSGWRGKKYRVAHNSPDEMIICEVSRDLLEKRAIKCSRNAERRTEMAAGGPKWKRRDGGEDMCVHPAFSKENSRMRPSRFTRRNKGWRRERASVRKKTVATGRKKIAASTMRVG